MILVVEVLMLVVGGSLMLDCFLRSLLLCEFFLRFGLFLFRVGKKRIFSELSGKTF